MSSSSQPRLGSISLPGEPTGCGRAIVLTTYRYGPCHLPIKRQVIAEGESRELRLELFPPIFNIYRLIASDDTALSGATPPSIHISKKASLMHLTTQIVAAYTKINTQFNRENAGDLLRIWHVQSVTQLDGPPESPKVLFPVGRLRKAKTKQIPLFSVSMATKTVEDSLMENGDLFVVEEKQANGEWLFNETPQASRAVTPLFGEASGNSFFSKFPSMSKATQSTLKERGSGFGITRSYSPTSKTPGTMGLSNL
jgi:hypothetical protein